MQCDLVRSSVSASMATEGLLSNVETQLTTGRKLSDEEFTKMEKIIDQIRRESGLAGLSPEERVMVVKAMGFSQGHWYKCPNNHVYAIGDCGGATEESKCPDCKAAIGGTGHKLVQSNTVCVIHPPSPQRPSKPIISTPLLPC